MSIATLARKSRAQRGASTRTGWTLATTKSGNCPGPCGGGAPAKQHSFRRLMKNKARPGRGCDGVHQQRVTGDWSSMGAAQVASPADLIGQSFTQPATGVTGILIEAGGIINGAGYGIFQLENCQTQFSNMPVPGTSAYYLMGATVALKLPSSDSVLPPHLCKCGGDCCPPVATWKKTNDPKGGQSIGYYLWRKKQLTHNCLKPVFPGCNCSRKCALIQTVDFTNIKGGPLPALGQVFTQLEPNNGIQGTLIGFQINDGSGTAVFHFEDCSPPFVDAGQGIASISVGTSTNNPGFTSIYTGQHPHVVTWSECSSCSCTCNKSMGGTPCCIVHKTMLPLSNSENIPRVIKDRTCLQIEKPDPRNPNIC